MKVIRYRDVDGTDQIGVIQPDGGVLRGERNPVAGVSSTRELARVDRILAPVIPPIIWCIGLNYRKHAVETGLKIPEYPVVFAKPATSLQDPGSPILLPSNEYSRQVDYECELVVIIRKDCKNVSRSCALDVIAGYTCGNDVSARDWQFQYGGSQWSRGKSFDTFAPIGPCLVTPDELPDPNRLRIQTRLNGELVQDSNTSDMIFDVATLIEFLSRETTLAAGTAIFTGTPEGIGMARKPQIWLAAGDEVSVIIEGIGTLTNPVQPQAQAPA
jgi:2-keto-4-pentenoate hydratase/2-oxohepta-3-ene-1,7-dioic acid hydratase in catechol pathway